MKLSQPTWRRVQIVAWIALVVICFLLVHFAENKAEDAQNEAHETNVRVTRIESPCTRYGSRDRRCIAAVEAGVGGINQREACFVIQKSGYSHSVRDAFRRSGAFFVDPCRGVHLRLHKPERKAKRALAHHSGANHLRPSALPSHSPPVRTSDSLRARPAPDNSARPVPKPATHNHPRAPRQVPPVVEPSAGQTPASSSPQKAPEAQHEPSAPVAPPSSVGAESVSSSPPAVEVTVGPIGATVGGGTAAGVTAPLPVEVCVPPLATVNC